MPHRLSIRALAPLLAILLAAQSPQPSAPDHLKNLRTQLQAARAKSDWPAALSLAQQINQYLNNYPRSLVDLARAQANAGDPASALHTLDQYAQMGQSLEQLDSAPAFAALRTNPKFAALQSALKANTAPVSNASTAFSLAVTNLLPEDIDYDPAAKRFLITSVLKKKIISATRPGTITDFATAPDPWPMMAIKIDVKRNLVWATEVALDGFTFVPKSDWGRSAVLSFDLKSGKLLSRIEAPRGEALGDMAIAPSGDLILSDGQTGVIYRLSADTTKLERIDNGEFISPQTPAFHPDGKRLFIPDYLRGIALFDPATKHTQWLSTEGKFALSGIDGLYLNNNQLIATQNGTSPERVIVFTLNASLDKIVSESILERSTPTLGDPTHGVVLGGDFYYIANSGWDALNDSGDLLAGAKLSSPRIMRAVIPRNR